MVPFPRSSHLEDRHRAGSSDRADVPRDVQSKRVHVQVRDQLVVQVADLFIIITFRDIFWANFFTIIVFFLFFLAHLFFVVITFFLYFIADLVEWPLASPTSCAQVGVRQKEIGPGEIAEECK